MISFVLQIPPVGGNTIYSTMMRCDRDILDNEYSRYNPNTSKINQLRPEARGIALLKTIKLYPLDSQQRSLDPRHTSNIKQLSTRDPSVFPVTKQLLDCYPPISPDEIAADPLWYDAPIVVANNKIRYKINQQRIIAHAKNKGCPVLFWRNPLAGENALLLSQAEKQQIYSTHLPLTSYFAAGVICTITENKSQLRGIVNGAHCIMHSLTLDPTEDTERSKRLMPDGTPMPPLHDCIRNAKPGDLVELIVPPISVNVTLPPEGDCTNFSDTDTLVPGARVIPMLLSAFSKSEAIQPWELLQRSSDPFKSISFLDHSLDFRYAITYHKMQVSAYVPTILLFATTPHTLSASFHRDRPSVASFLISTSGHEAS